MMFIALHRIYPFGYCVVILILLVANVFSSADWKTCTGQPIQVDKRAGQAGR